MSGTEIIYGLHAVQSLLTRDASRVLKVQLSRGREDERAVAVLAAAMRAQIAVERVDARRLDKLTGGAVHQGVIAEVRPLAQWSEDALITALGAALGAASGEPLILALDGVQDPHKLGACLRTADAAGVHAVIVPRDRAAGLSPVVRKVAAGAAETVPLIQVTNLSRTLRWLKERGLWIVGTDDQAQTLLHTAKLDGPLAIVMGAEGDGMRRLTKENCDLLVNIPMRGVVESLNVSVATGVMLYEVVRQRAG